MDYGGQAPLEYIYEAVVMPISRGASKGADVRVPCSQAYKSEIRGSINKYERSMNSPMYMWHSDLFREYCWSLPLWWVLEYRATKNKYALTVR